MHPGSVWENKKYKLLASRDRSFGLESRHLGYEIARIALSLFTRLRASWDITGEECRSGHYSVYNNGHYSVVTSKLDLYIL